MPAQETSTSLLSRVRDLADQSAWREFDQRYRELMLRFCRRRGLPHVDAEDVTQRVLANLTTTLPQFVYNRQRGRFRDYLYRSLQNAIGEWAARPNRHWQPLVTDIAGEPAQGAADSAATWEQEWVAHHYRLALGTVRRTFEACSVEIFERNLAGGSVAGLADEFGLSEQAVYKLRQRIRDRMEALIAQQVTEEDDVDGSDSA